MRFPSFPNDEHLQGSWEALGVGAPTIGAFAMLCGRVLAGWNGPSGVGNSDSSAAELAGEHVALAIEARAILYAARERGLLEIKAVNTAFETPDRLLAVHVEQEPERGIVFRSRLQPEFTIRCLEGFRQLCAAGLIMHHLFREFSLTERGFAAARRVEPDEVQAVLDQAAEYGY